MTAGVTDIARGVASGEPVRSVESARTVHRAFLRVIERDGPGILRMLWRLLGNEADVMDAYQECWCLLAQLGNPRDVRSVRAYAYRTASNVAIEMIRRRKRRRRHWNGVVERYAARTAGRDAPDLTEDVSIDRLRDLLGTIPPHLRNVITLRDLAGMAYKEVGALLGIAPATARVYRRQAIVKLAELIREDGP